MIDTLAETGLIGEVVEASLHRVMAETPQERRYAGPMFGSFVRCPEADGKDIFAVVAAVETSSLDPNRRATAFWQAEEDLRQNQPQIFELLSTHFEAIIVGHLQAGMLKCRIPPRPPRVHGFVYTCSESEICDLTGQMGILRVLLNSPIGAPDELVAAVLRQGAAARQQAHTYLVAAGKQLAMLLRDDYLRLQAILRMID